LTKIKEPARVSARFIEHLVRGIGHDLGAPARHVVQFAHLLETGNEPPLSAKQLQWLSYVSQGGTQLQDMLTALAIMGRLTSQSDAYEKIDPHSLMHECIDEIKSAFPESLITFNFSHSNASDQMLGCYEHWRTLICAILHNACTFQPQDERHDIQIDIEMKVRSDQIYFEINDNGIGVNESQIPDLCRPFKRLNSTADYNGLGMGLSYCYLISELNNAYLEFSKSTMGGLRVSYTQPITEQMRAP